MKNDGVILFAKMYRCDIVYEDKTYKNKKQLLNYDILTTTR